jgi:hypothetical protein
MYKVPPHTMTEPNQNSVDKYYSDQVGGNLPVYAGAMGQRGHGLGMLAKGAMSAVTPLLKNYALPLLKRVGRKLFSAGKRRAKKAAMGVAKDFVAGGNLKRSLKNRGLEMMTSGTGGRKKRPKKVGIRRRGPHRRRSIPQTGGRRGRRSRSIIRRRKKKRCGRTIFG